MVTNRRQWRRLALLASLVPAAAAATLYSTPGLQSPDEAEAGAYLLLPGAGLERGHVVRLRDPAGTEIRLVPEPDSPLPHGLLVRLPRGPPGLDATSVTLEAEAHRPAAVVRLNAARVDWLSPRVLRRSHARRTEPEELWIVGRALLQAGQAPILRLQGTASSPPLHAVRSAREYLVYELPASLAPGAYELELRWPGSAQSAGSLRVESAGEVTQELDLAALAPHPCQPDDGIDDAPCLRHGLALLQERGGGTLRIAPGRWTLQIAPATGAVVVPAGVSIQGASGGDSVLEVRRLLQGQPYAAIVLRGRNTLSDLIVEEARPHEAADPPTTAVALGEPWQVVADAAARIADVTIRNTRIRGVYRAISDQGLAVDRLRVIGNTLMAHETALALGGNRFRMTGRFLLRDSVIAGNRFVPGALFDLRARRGPIAVEIGGSLRLRFTGNRAEAGAVAGAGGIGWRAAFFWHLQDNHEQLLVAHNDVECAGGRIGDGEAIALDNNANTFGFDAPAPILGATRNSLVLGGRLRSRQNQRDVPLPGYYVGHWLQVVSGTGRSQARRIVRYRIEADADRTHFDVEPAWDAIPTGADAQATVARLFWQATVVDNHVDQRRERCARRNPAGPRGGGISLWANTVDSLVARNVIEQGDGIVVNHSFGAGTRQCTDCAAVLLQTRLRVERNVIAGENDVASSCSASGIELRHGAADTAGYRPPLLGFAAQIGRNVVFAADGLRGGGVSAPLAWHPGPPGPVSALVGGLVVQQNVVAGLPASPATGPCTGAPVSRVGMFFESGGTVAAPRLHSNVCETPGATTCDMP